MDLSVRDSQVAELRAEIRREFDNRVYPWLLDHDDTLKAHDRWIERAKGFMSAIGIVASAPAIILGWLMLSGKIN